LRRCGGGLRGAGPLLKSGEGNLRLAVLAAGKAEHRLRRTPRSVVEQALVDVPDLLDVESTERESARLGGAAARHSDTENLQRFQQMEYGAIVHW
jgi:hypothetical protein